jgi:hypothetical protein
MSDTMFREIRPWEQPFLETGPTQNRIAQGSPCQDSSDRAQDRITDAGWGMQSGRGRTAISRRLHEQPF